MGTRRLPVREVQGEGPQGRHLRRPGLHPQDWHPDQDLPDHRRHSHHDLCLDAPLPAGLVSSLSTTTTPRNGQGSAAPADMLQDSSEDLPDHRRLYVIADDTCGQSQYVKYAKAAEAAEKGLKEGSNYLRVIVWLHFGSEAPRGTTYRRRTWRREADRCTGRKRGPSNGDELLRLRRRPRVQQGTMVQLAPGRREAVEAALRRVGGGDEAHDPNGLGSHNGRLEGTGRARHLRASCVVGLHGPRFGSRTEGQN